MQANENQRLQECRRKIRKKILLYGLFFVLKPIRENLLKRLDQIYMEIRSLGKQFSVRHDFQGTS